MLRSLYALALLCALAAPVAAQTASVSGTITDQSGAAVPGATVTLAGPGGTASTTSGSRGEYSFPNLANGPYRITATLSGFAPATRDVVVAGGSNVDVPWRFVTFTSRAESRMTLTPGSERRRSP